MNIKVVLSLCCLITVFSCEKRASTDSVNAEANSRIEELAAEKGIEGEDLESLKAMVTSIARTQNHFSFEYLSEHCDEDFERLCSLKNSRSWQHASLTHHILSLIHI